MREKYKTLIISCWVVLLCCFVVKLLGGNFFEIVCKNEKYIAFTNFFNQGIPYILITTIFYVVSTSIVFMAICKFEKPKWWVILATFIFITIKQVLYKYVALTFILEFGYMIVLPIIYNKKLWLRAIIGVLLVLLFQIISLITKNIGIKFLYYDVFTAIIFTIDYYIMIILYWLYSIKEENDGSFWFILFRKRR